MTDLDGRPRLTARGAATRARIVAAAADLMHVQGVAATSLDQVTAATATSKSQLYQHFADKDALVRAVIAYRAAWVMEAQRPGLERLNSLRGLERWRDAMVQGRVLRSGAYGCPLGSLVSELADSEETVRAELAAGFAAWEELFDAGLASQVRDMLAEAVECEVQFAADLLGDGIPGLSLAGMREYLQHVADRRLGRLGIEPLYGSANPLQFMELQDVQELSNFFERRVSAYQVGVTGSVAFDHDF